MEQIILEIDESSAKKWKCAPVEKRERISKSIEQLINKALTQSDDDFWEFIDRISKKAADNGLTEEVLNNMLDEK